MGIRSLIEHMMIDKCGDHNSFKANVSAFCEAGYISAVQADYLTNTLEAGHAASHRAWRPTSSELSTLMDVTESLVESVYVLGKKVERVKSTVPPRPSRKVSPNP
jgi:hypothetical protein